MAALQEELDAARAEATRHVKRLEQQARDAKAEAEAAKVDASRHAKRLEEQARDAEVIPSLCLLPSSVLSAFY